MVLTDTTPSLLSLEGVNKSFASTPVLQDINLRLEEGEILFLLGASGCGKTTLLRLIAGFEVADSGSMSIRERRIFDDNQFVPAKDRRLGYVLQEGVLFPHLNVYRNIAYGLGNGKGKTAAERQRIHEVMELTGILPLAERMPHQISGGQQQRVALARALAPKPNIMLLDEPFSALDEHLRAQIRKDVTDILRRSKAAAIIVTHDRHEALSCADKIALIQDGRLVQFDTPQTIYQQPKTIDIARFIGDQSVIVDATLCEEGSFAASQLGDKIPVLIQPNLLSKGMPGQKGKLLIRSEQLTLLPADVSNALIKTKINHIEFHGEYSQINVTAMGASINMSIKNSQQPLNIGDTISLQIAGKGIFYPLSLDCYGQVGD